MRGIRGLIVFLLLLLIFEIIFLPIITADSNLNNSSENIITVSKLNGDYANIQEAINQATEGSTIMIKSGTYNEIIEINKIITIIGENKFDTIINSSSDKNKYAIKLSVSDITIKDLSISNEAFGLYTTGLRISGDRSKILNCNFYDNPIGIAIFSNENIINNCSFRNCRDEGIALIGTKTSNCDFNIISNCTFFNNCDGMELQYSSNNKIENCSIFNNSHTGIDAIISSNNNNIINNCKIYNNNVNGIYLSDSYNNLIISCFFWGNKNGDIIDKNLSSNNTYLNDTFDNIFDNDINYNDSNDILFSGFNNNIQNNRFRFDLLNKLIEMISNIIPIINNYF